MFPGKTLDFHGFVCHQFTVDGCTACVAEPKTPLPDRPWIWRTMFWDAFPAVDIALLNRGFYIAFIDVGNTFGSPDALLHFDAFYKELTGTYHLAPKAALEGLSRGGLYAYRWGYQNTGKVACIYADAPVCDMKIWPGGKGKAAFSAENWQQALQSYHFTTDQQMLDFKGNPVDTLAPLAAAHVPVIHVCGEADKDVPIDENSDIMHDRYTKMGGTFVYIRKQGCEHHPHSLSDPTSIVDFIVAHAAGGEAGREAKKTALKPGTVIELPQGKW